MLRLVIALFAFAVLSPALAAESYDNCTGTISTLPTTISTQGTWCLKANRVTSITTGSAITIAASNVTIDCNHFRISGVAGGAGTNAYGILGSNRLGVTVRNCTVSGFLEGIRVAGTAAGAVIEHNRLEQNTDVGITVAGSGHLVAFNRILDTGGRPASTRTDGIVSTAVQSQITDNAVIGMTVTANGGEVVGISSTGNACEIGRNYITGLVPDDTGKATGIRTATSSASSIHRNQILSSPDVNGTAILAGAGTQCGNNNHSGWDSGVVGCTDAGGNFGN
jgi:hypothetical protein